MQINDFVSVKIWKRTKTA